MSETSEYNISDTVSNPDICPDQVNRRGAAMDKYSFIMGMITAFCECVAGGCKKLALSPPMTREDFDLVKEEAYSVIEKHGLIHYHEDNRDLPETDRVDWILIAGSSDTIDNYLQLRRKGLNPVTSFSSFYELLSYDPAISIHTGYDAYKEYFQNRS